MAIPYRAENVSIAGEYYDAFGRMRTSSPNTLIDFKQIHDNLPLHFDVSISGTGSCTYDSSNARSILAVSGSGDSVVRQSFMRFNYQPGKSLQIILTGNFNSGVLGTTKRIGYFDQNNGVFFELQGSTLYVVERKNGNDTKTAQSSWNINTLSDINLGKVQIFAIDLEWLGVGTIRYGFVINGEYYYCHKSHHANISSSVYMSTPNLPIRYEISSSSGVSSLDQICSSVISEGGLQKIGSMRTIISDKVDANSLSTKYAVIGIRLKSTHIGAWVEPQNIDLLSITSDNYVWSLMLNPTVSGTFTYNDLNNSSIQWAQGSTANVVVGGTIVAGGFGKGDSNLTLSINSALRLGSSINDVRDTLVLAVEPLSINLDIYGALSFQELQ